MEPFAPIADPRQRHRRLAVVTELWRQQMREIEGLVFACFLQQDLPGIADLSVRKQALQKRLHMVEILLQVWDS